MPDPTFLEQEVAELSRSLENLLSKSREQGEDMERLALVMVEQRLTGWEKVALALARMWATRILDRTTPDTERGRKGFYLPPGARRDLIAIRDLGKSERPSGGPSDPPCANCRHRASFHMGGGVCLWRDHSDPFVATMSCNCDSFRS